MDFSEIATSEWVSAGATLLIGLAVSFVINRSIHTAAKPLRMQEDLAKVISRIARALVLILAVVLALEQLDVKVGPLIGALGIGGVLVALSLQPVLGNLVGSIMLQARRPIRRGDQIHTNGQSGTVIDINGRAVVLKTFDGEIVHLPNLKVLEEPLVNQTSDEHRRTLIPFQVSYDTDLRATQRVLVKKLRDLDALAGAPQADVLVTGFGESGVDMVARIWHFSEELTGRWAISEAAIAIRETLAEAGVTIPFPQRVLHLGRGMDTATATVVTGLQNGQYPGGADDNGASPASEAATPAEHQASS
jgi:small-conductance mechanosensitive channel